MRSKTIWIVIADGVRARIFVNKGPGIGLEAGLLQALVADNRPSGDIASDRPGRAFDSSGAGRHALQPSTDPHRHSQVTFASDITKVLEEQCKKKAFDQLVVIAAPRVLGDLRAALGKEIRKLVLAEIDKDLTKLPIHNLANHLGNVIKL